jgi:hypothetical protein
MDLKYQESTINRPKGDRVIDAPYVIADLKKFRNQLKKEDAWENGDRNSITVYKSEGTTILLTCLKEDADLVDNKVEGLLTIQVLDGTVECMVHEDIVKVKKNQLIVLHEEIPISIRAKEESLLLLTTQNRK